MPKFDPSANDDFCLRICSQEKRFRVVEHPNAAGMPHAMEGAKATVFRVKNLDTREDHYALKLMKKLHRIPYLEELCTKLDALKELPGLVVCERRCLSPSVAQETIDQLYNLKYSILMPWVAGQSWFDVLHLGKKGKSLFSKSQAMQLASNLAQILSGLEQRGIAHCDLSAGNAIIDPGKLQIELIDVEEIYAPGFQEPLFNLMGTPGYQHRTSKHGQWRRKGDRFAGAIMIAEMLGWYDYDVRTSSYGESYFDQREVQSTQCQRFSILHKAISGHHPELANLLQKAWDSTSLDDCPSMHEWDRALKQAKENQPIREVRASSSIGTTFSPFWANPAPESDEPENKNVIWVTEQGTKTRETRPAQPNVMPESGPQSISQKLFEWVKSVADLDEKENGKTR